MPWRVDDYPSAMRRLPAAVRAKAINIANTLLDAGHDEGSAIRIAVARAKRWGMSRPLMGHAFEDVSSRGTQEYDP